MGVLAAVLIGSALAGLLESDKNIEGRIRTYADLLHSPA